MRQQDHKHESPAGADDSLWTVLPVALIVVLTVGVVTMGVLKSCNFGPTVGDVIVFQPGSVAQPAEGSPPVEVVARFARPAGRTTCTLNPAAMAAGGGSLVVERTVSTRSSMYQVHWAGQSTSNGADNCGAAADLLLGGNDLLDLAGAAGGFGIGRKFIAALPIPHNVPTMVD